MYVICITAKPMNDGQNEPMKKVTLMLEPDLIQKLKERANKEHKKYQALAREYIWLQFDKTKK